MFTELLKEYYLEGYYNAIYMKQKTEEYKTTPMRSIILVTAKEWRKNKPYEGKELIVKVIDTISTEEMKEALRILTDIKEDN